MTSRERAARMPRSKPIRITSRITIRQDKPDPGDMEWIEVTRGPAGEILLVVWEEASQELDGSGRYQPERWTRETYRWCPRVGLWAFEWRANDLYPGRRDHVKRCRVEALPTRLLELVERAR